MSTSPSPAKVSARTILGLAIPALGALVAEPLFLLVDSAFVAHVSTTALAGLSIASTILTTVVGLSIFLAYSTTAAVARAVGQGRIARAVALGIDAAWLGLAIGFVSALLIAVFAPTIVALFGPKPDVANQAVTYLRISAIGLPAMLLIQAAMGLVRGLQNTTITLIVAGIGAAINVPLNWVLIFEMGLGIAGSAIGTAMCQWAMALWYIVIIVRGARKHRASLVPNLGGVTSAWRSARWLFIRTVTMRVVLLVATAVALHMGEVTLAGNQLMNSVFALTALALDSLAIAAQALTGKYLGSGDIDSVRSVTGRLVRWSFLGGIAVAALLLIAALTAPHLFTPDPTVQEALFWALLVLLIAQPLAGYVFVWDGVFMGAGDARYLGIAGIITMVTYLPFAGLLWWAAEADVLHDLDRFGLAFLWLVFTLVFLGTRAVTLWWRSRTDAWMHRGDGNRAS